ncbi:MAG TPA: hypothetical protein VKB77_08350 [Terriglobales bacterium]|nr:hypothetical protein [Terriglobales bacterium]
MSVSHKWATGKYANAICDYCGVRTKYRELRGTTIKGQATGLLACSTCWDPDHEQNFLPDYVTVDAQALRNARPDTGKAASRQLYPNNNWLIPPFPPAAARRLEFRDEEESA